jgi:uncharacterized glyoxalase superfamily protein PhnB
LTHEHDHDGHDHDHHDHDHGPRHFFGVVPVFLVDDVLATVEYYRDVLGFEVNFLYEEPPTYASVSRDDAILNFSRSNPPGRRNGVAMAGPGNGTDVYIVVSDIEELYEELVAHGVQVLIEPDSYDYGMREFKIADLNGYQIIFGEEVEDFDDEDDDEDEEEL